MTDREMLELAAKAAGANDVRIGGDSVFVQWKSNARGYVHWNPLADDGDALRLAVKLRIEYIFVSDRQSIQCQFAQHTEMGDC